eukprot:INCI7612.1.p1 GENE.INCI7612.1~~INCI7612.1.p1  ORF type:complete len:1020 (+),score=128.59 INCI7612.1:850-3909(+)
MEQPNASSNSDAATTQPGTPATAAGAGAKTATIANTAANHTSEASSSAPAASATAPAPGVPQQMHSHDKSHSKSDSNSSPPTQAALFNPSSAATLATENTGGSGMNAAAPPGSAGAPTTASLPTPAPVSTVAGVDFANPSQDGVAPVERPAKRKMGDVSGVSRVEAPAKTVAVANGVTARSVPASSRQEAVVSSGSTESVARKPGAPTNIISPVALSNPSAPLPKNPKQSALVSHPAGAHAVQGTNIAQAQGKAPQPQRQLQHQQAPRLQLSHPRQQRQEVPVEVRISRYDMHKLRVALRGPDPQPVMAKLGLRPSSIPYFLSLKFRFYLGEIGEKVTCLEYARHFKTNQANRRMAILRSFDELSHCRWTPKTHALYSTGDQASIAAFFSVAEDDGSTASTSSSTVVPGQNNTGGPKLGSSVASKAPRARPPANIVDLVLRRYVRRGWFEPDDASDVTVAFADMHESEQMQPTAPPDDKMATDFVTKVKTRCSDAAYQIFLETLEQSRHQDSPNRPTTTALLLEINQTMQELFKDEKDLFSGFSQFMPQDKFSCLKNFSLFTQGVRRRQELVAKHRSLARLELEAQGFRGCMLVGHTGRFKGLMGLYSLESRAGGSAAFPVFKKVEPLKIPNAKKKPRQPPRKQDVYLFRADDGRWWVSDYPDSRDGAAAGWLVSRRACSIPSDATVKGWEVWQHGKGFVGDPDIVCVMSPGLVTSLRQDAQARAEQLEQEAKSSLLEGGLRLRGHTGRYAMLMGQYDALPERPINEASVYAQRVSRAAHGKRFLFRGYDGRWWVSDHDDMITGNARGWLKSDRSDYDGPQDARWEVFDSRVDPSLGPPFVFDPELTCEIKSQNETSTVSNYAHARKLTKARLMKQSVCLEGHTAEYATLMGVYVLTNKNEEDHTKMVFRQLGTPYERLLYRGTSGQWWVGSSAHKAAPESVGWLVTAKPCLFPTDQTWFIWSKENAGYVQDTSISVNMPPQSQLRLPTSRHALPRDSMGNIVPGQPPMYWGSVGGMSQ